MAQGLTPWLLTLTIPLTGDLERDWSTWERFWSSFARNLGRDLHGHVRCAGPYLRPDGSLGINFHVLVIPRSNLEVSTLLTRWCALTGASPAAQYAEPVRHLTGVARYVTAQLWNASPSAPARLLDAFHANGDLDDRDTWHAFERAAQGRRAVTVSRSFDSLRPARTSNPETNKETTMPKLIDLTGRRFGLLVVQAQDISLHHQGGRPFVTWRCRCDCGATKVVRAGHLRAGYVRSCGDRKLHPARPRGVRGYNRAHALIRRLKGKATDFLCVLCGSRPAQTWAFIGESGNEYRTEGGIKYSIDPDDYWPLCRSCHGRLDTPHKAAAGRS